MRASLCLVLILLVPVVATSQERGSFVVRHVRVFDGERAIDDRDVVVEGGRIARVVAGGAGSSAGATVIEGRGRTLLPGLMDAHVHLSDSAAADLRQALSFGVTTVFDMFSAGSRFEGIKALRDADADTLAAAFTAGLGASAPGGHPSQMGGPPITALARIDDAESFVAARKAEGSNYLKVMHDDLSSLGAPVPMLDSATVAALVVAAHRHGLRAVVHVTDEARARSAVGAGADGLVHLFAGATVGPDFGAYVARHGAFVVPTLTVFQYYCGNPSGPDILADSLLAPFVRPALRTMLSRTWTPRGGAKSCEGTNDAMRQLVAAGATIVAGTDSPVPGLTYGATLHGEFRWMVRAGLTPIQVLTAATSASARAFGLTDRGRIAPGLRADLVLVEGDPTREIGDTRRIVAVWKRGVRAERTRY